MFEGLEEIDGTNTERPERLILEVKKQKMKYTKQSDN